MKFDQLGLAQNVLKALLYKEPTPIQIQAIPEILEGKDIHASADTGTGKTAAFLLPAITFLTKETRRSGKGPRVLILAPTRELAMQIETETIKYCKFLKEIKTVCITGGVPYKKQYRDVEKQHDILIATPGRLIDLIERRKVALSSVAIVVLDEADRMLDIGFAEPVKTLIAKTPDTRQTLLFSATYEGSIVQFAKKLLKDPVQIFLKKEGQNHKSIEQVLHFADNIEHKNQMLDHILQREEVNHSIIFISSKKHSTQLANKLIDKGHKAAALHGDLNQRQRTRTIQMMRTGKIKVLVATDVASRGIDVPTITHVINFDLPQCAEDYVHRIGRTGRAGASGQAITFVSGHSNSIMLKKIQQFTGHTIPVKKIEGLEPLVLFEPQKRKKPSFKKKSWGQKEPSFSKGREKTFSSPAKKKPSWKRSKQKRRSF